MEVHEYHNSTEWSAVMVCLSPGQNQTYSVQAHPRILCLHACSFLFSVGSFSLLQSAEDNKTLFRHSPRMHAVVMAYGKRAIGCAKLQHN